MGRFVFSQEDSHFYPYFQIISYDLSAFAFQRQDSSASLLVSLHIETYPDNNYSKLSESSGFFRVVIPFVLVTF